MNKCIDWKCSRSLKKCASHPSQISISTERRPSGTSHLGLLLNHFVSFQSPPFFRSATWTSLRFIHSKTLRVTLPFPFYMNKYYFPKQTKNVYKLNKNYYHLKIIMNNLIIKKSLSRASSLHVNSAAAALASEMSLLATVMALGLRIKARRKRQREAESPAKRNQLIDPTIL